ncbi:MAG: hypothetical protein ACFBSE_23430 [Prochloraceae cyanobacterium]
MRCDLDLKGTQLESQLKAIGAEIGELAEQHQGDCNSLLSLLRYLEYLHRTIREDFFEQSLPDTRHALYDFLKQIDETGGWPYIERMKLQDFVLNLQELTAEDDRAET